MTAASPRRIRRERTKGWRMPDGAIYVGRPTKWGNPHTVESLREDFDAIVTTDAGLRSLAKSMFTSSYIGGDLPFDMEDVKRELRGHDLACWCPLDQPCHADVLLAIANGPHAAGTDEQDETR